jgi:tetratricopeptide (TPR) repeat protein
VQQDRPDADLNVPVHTTPTIRRQGAGPVPKRLCGAILAALLIAVLAEVGSAQDVGRPVPGDQPQGQLPPFPGLKRPPAPKAEPAPKPVPKFLRRPGATSVPERASDRAKLLDELYSYLATATDENVAKRTAAAIEHVWLVSGSETVSLLMQRATRAANESKPELAINLLDKAVQLAPDYPELFNRRAVVHFSQNSVEQALGDLRRTLALDPNHYKALEGLGQILKEIGRKKAALQVYRKLYAVHPFMAGAKSTIEELEREVEGQRS